jgi:hypothetical protein
MILVLVWCLWTEASREGGFHLRRWRMSNWRSDFGEGTMARWWRGGRSARSLGGKMMVIEFVSVNTYGLGLPRLGLRTISLAEVLYEGLDNVPYGFLASCCWKGVGSLLGAAFGSRYFCFAAR